jgi:hypothetical protein
MDGDMESVSDLSEPAPLGEITDLKAKLLEYKEKGY